MIRYEVANNAVLLWILWPERSSREQSGRLLEEGGLLECDRSSINPGPFWNNPSWRMALSSNHLDLGLLECERAELPYLFLFVIGLLISIKPFYLVFILL